MSDFDELAARIDGTARVLMALIADLERRELLDGERFCHGLRDSAQGRGEHQGLERSAAVMEQIAAQLDEARSNRRSAAMKTGSPRNRG